MSSYIYEGFWINWSGGPFLGATLTVSSSNGLVLAAFIAIFVGTLGGSAWGIICFVLHQVSNTRTPQDGLYHQKQVIIRNSSNPATTVGELVQVARAWRRKAPHTMLRVIPLIFVASLQLALFTAAGIFSSNMFSQTNEVLIRSPSCGFILYPNTSWSSFTTADFERENAGWQEAHATANFALDYARTCYTDGGQSPKCTVFSVPQISSTFEQVSCPFDASMCINPVNGSLRADSGLINSNVELGINSKSAYSWNYRRVTTCSPLNVDGYWEKLNGTSYNLPGEQFYNFYYGQSVVGGNVVDYTFNISSYFLSKVRDPYSVGYGFSQIGAWVPAQSTWTPGYSTFAPIPQLNRTDADVTLIYIVNNQFYTNPVNDLLYNSTVLVTDAGKIGYSYDAPLYVAPTPMISIMGCIEQHQFCDPTLPADQSCGPLTGWNQAQLSPETGERWTVFSDLCNIIENTFILDMFQYLGSSALNASMQNSGAFATVTAPLPDNQWVYEIQGWHNYLMALLQKLVVNVAAGPSNPALNSYISPPSSIVKYSNLFDLCLNQKVRNQSYYSFSVFGLVTTIVGGCTIILLNTFLPKIVGTIQKITKKGLDLKEDWELDHLLQVQRMAFEGHKLGTWTGRAGGVPTTLSAFYNQRRMSKPARTNSNAYEPLHADTVSLGFSSEPSLMEPSIRSPPETAAWTTYDTPGYFGKYSGYGGLGQVEERELDEVHLMSYKAPMGTSVREL